MAAPEATAMGTLTPAAFEARVLGFLGFGVVALGLVFCLPPIPQDPAYHAFADGRTMLGVRNFLNVASNVPFVVVGALGLGALFRPGAVGPGGSVLDPAERWPLAVLFVGVFLTGFGSAYYHLDPNNETLVWDRLPMTVAFMGLFAAMIGERVGVRAGTWLLGPLVWLGLVSAVAWHLSERRWAGDLRLYGFVQFYPLVTIPLLLYQFPPRYTRGGDIMVALGWYLLAKVLEHGPVEHSIFGMGHVVSGHTLKHLAAAAGAYWLARMVWRRRPAPMPPH
jgi:hypothetical protein